MPDTLSHLSSSTRLLHRSKEKDEKRAQERRRNLLYVVADFLRENGYTESHETFCKEARLCGEISVCDNIDLDTILVEYSDYYFTKFNKYPKICKKIDSHIPGSNKAVQNIGKREKVNKNSRKQQEPSLCKDSESAPMFPSMKITSIFPAYDNLDLSLNQSQNEGGFGDKKFSKPVSDLYPHGSELRELADTISREIVMTNLNVHWDDVKGLEECKVQLKEASVYPIKYPSLFKGKLRPWRGILLYGPPGTGKTMLAKCVATYCQHATFFNITSSSIVSKWRGESEKYVRVLSDMAKYYAPSIIFIDEIDWTATGSDESWSMKSEPSRRFRAELLARLDGLFSDDDASVLLLAATNIPWDLDAALLRRLEKRILVDVPDENARREILAYYINKVLLDTSEFKEFLKNTEGYSCADLRVLCKQAYMLQLRPIWKNLECDETLLNNLQTEDCVNEMRYLFEAMENVRPIVKQLAEKYRKWKKHM